MSSEHVRTTATATATAAAAASADEGARVQTRTRARTRGRAKLIAKRVSVRGLRRESRPVVDEDDIDALVRATTRAMKMAKEEVFEDGQSPVAPASECHAASWGRGARAACGGSCIALGKTPPALHATNTNTNTNGHSSLTFVAAESTVCGTIRTSVSESASVCTAVSESSNSNASGAGSSSSSNTVGPFASVHRKRLAMYMHKAKEIASEVQGEGHADGDIEGHRDGDIEGNRDGDIEGLQGSTQMPQTDTQPSADEEDCDVEVLAEERNAKPLVVDLTRSQSRPLSPSQLRMSSLTSIQ